MIRLPVALSVLVKRCFYSSNEVLMFRLRLAWGAAGGVIASVAKPEQPPSRQTVAGPGSLTLEQLSGGKHSGAHT